MASNDAQSLAPSPEKQQIEALHAQLQSALHEIGALRQRVLAESQSQADLARISAESAPEESIWWPAWDGFRRGFVLAYSIRAGLGTMTRALALAKAGRYKDMRGWRLVSESGLKYREDAVRLGFFIGGFTGSYHLLNAALTKWRGDAPAQNCMAAGTVAGLTLLFLSKERRRTLALYMLARLAQCAYNSLKEQGLFHFWGSDWAYGDALLFALSSAQVMYAYVMRPETLPLSYWKFIVKSGPVEAPALEAVRRSIRGIPIDLKAFNAFLTKRGSSAFLANALPKQIPDAMLHPGTASAAVHNLKVPLATFRKTFPLYMSISLVPYVVLNLRRALKSPLGTAAHAVGSAVRSTSFLSAFVGIYSSVISLQRLLFSWDNKLVYYVAGLVASGSILIEKKSRRSELALYVMPRAVDSFVLGMMKRRWVPSVKFGEVLLFSLCMGGLMYFRQHEPQTMAPLLNTLISRIVFGETKKKRGDLPRPASLAFSEGDFPGGLHHALSSAALGPALGSLQQPSAVSSPARGILQEPSASAALSPPGLLPSTRSDQSRLQHEGLSNADPNAALLQDAGSAANSPIQGLSPVPLPGQSQTSIAPSGYPDEARLGAALSDDVSSSASKQQQQTLSQAAVAGNGSNGESNHQGASSQGNGRRGSNGHPVAPSQKSVDSIHAAARNEASEQTQNIQSPGSNGNQPQQDRNRPQQGESEETGSRQQPGEVSSTRAAEQGTVGHDGIAVSEQLAAETVGSVSSRDAQFASLVQGTNDLISQIAASQLR